jgi:DNA-binding MarR family transcriptional regulator
VRVRREQSVGGQPIKRVRDFLRKVGIHEISTGFVASEFNLRPQGANLLVRELISHGYLEVREKLNGERRVWYRLGPEARRLINSKFLKRISRDQARLLIRQFLERVQEVNCREELTHIVTEVRVFGSYLEDVQDLGDVDLAVDLQPRQDDGAAWVERCLARAEQSGRRFSNYLQELYYSRGEVLGILKAKNPYISLHDIKQLDVIGARAEQIFKA